MSITPAALSALAKGDMQNAMIASTPGGIERQEKDGQIEQSFLDTLPKHLKREQFEALGFKFLGDHDDIFLNVKFPKGWRKSPTDHSMWTDIIDAQGRKRGAIFYKAAFYDRSAHAHLTCRFTQSDLCYRGDHPKSAPGQRIVVDGATGEIVFRSDEIARPAPNDADRERFWKADDASRSKVQAWLEQNKPDYQNPLAYWE